MNFLKFKLNQNNVKISRKNNSFITTFLCGGGAGIANWIVTLPIDIIRTRLISFKIHSDAKSFLKTSECCQRIYNENGLLGFYKGFRVIFIRSVVVNGFTLSIFDYLRRITGLKE